MKRVLPQIPQGRAVLPATQRPTRGVISWNMNTSCNYRCTYCTQRFLENRARWADDVPRFMRAFARLEGPWEVKLSGGEPFVHPRFFDIIRGLSTLSMRISVVTNFSASTEQLMEFVQAAGDGLGVLSCSLHLDYVSLADDAPKRGGTVSSFIERCKTVMAQLPKNASLCVTTVATREILPQLPALHTRFQDAGVVLKIQPEKQDRDVISYSAEEAEVLLSLGGHNLTGELTHDFAGQPCWAGAKYFILDDLGNAFRCYPARRYRSEPLGNFLEDSFSLRDEASPCLYTYCNCTVPIARGMMPRGQGDESGAMHALEDA